MKEVLGLRGLVRRDLGYTPKRKTPVANPNKKATRKLQARIREWESDVANTKAGKINHHVTNKPGSMKV